ncbi:MAG: tetratricopeptide repeat protein, partial [Desulfovibrionaceae bacterium]|nr:tetratricopeptide repeat protein [Desulfovibrionaceae bacterium]
QFYILDSLAWVHYRMGNFNLAWDLIREAVRLDSTSDPEIWEHYGDIARGRGLPDEARSGYRKAIQDGEGRLDIENLRRKLEDL